ncbi:hypothetical protein DFJ58DRAFT_807094 [Suillus subalutaceus]|uniref:uncharacterized protein n=1 Tax=Suillus subalutaceus TaxID=48586 RepID=UPI001B85BA28|nr:uncharacterized protein DFJ58DRAFT_807094 [Suillus subalutaceus]KAG1842023.1 hypothetical protein DFJ58DRAFT_807094 [Suillus subalutaceus]
MVATVFSPLMSNGCMIYVCVTHALGIDHTRMNSYRVFRATLQHKQSHVPWQCHSRLVSFLLVIYIILPGTVFRVIVLLSSTRTVTLKYTYTVGALVESSRE